MRLTARADLVRPMTKGDKRFCSNGKTFALGFTAIIRYVPLFPLARGVNAEAGKACFSGVLVDGPSVVEAGPGVGGKFRISNPSISNPSSCSFFIPPTPFTPLDPFFPVLSSLEEV